MGLSILKNSACTEHYTLGLGFGLILFALGTFIFDYAKWRQDWLLTHHRVNYHMIAIEQDEEFDSLDRISQSHLFGNAFSKSSHVPVTNLQLHVTGIVKIDNMPNESKAYISIAGQPSKIYRIGDRVVDNVVVYAVTAESIILENDHQLEQLPLRREPLQFRAREALSNAEN